MKKSVLAVAAALVAFVAVSAQEPTAIQEPQTVPATEQTTPAEEPKCEESKCEESKPEAQPAAEEQAPVETPAAE